MHAYANPKWSKLTVLFLLIALGIVFASSMASGSAEQADRRMPLPNKPPFAVDKAGRVIPASLPESIGVAGSDGRVSRHISREEMLELLAPPSGPPGQVVSRTSGPKPDVVTITEEKADGSTVSTTTDTKSGKVSRTETSADPRMSS